MRIISQPESAVLDELRNTGYGRSPRFILQAPKVSKSVTRTIRVDNDVEDRLVEIAEKNKATVNSLVARALRRFVEWDYYADRFGLVTVPDAILRKIFGVLTEEQARNVGKWAGDHTIPELINFWYKQITLNTILDSMEMMGNKYGRAFKFEQSTDRDNHTLILKHDKGRQTSAFYSEALKSLATRIGMSTQPTETDEQLVIKVLSKQLTIP
jgi:hypothetical protein